MVSPGFDLPVMSVLRVGTEEDIYLHTKMLSHGLVLYVNSLLCRRLTHSLEFTWTVLPY